jgi:hypothetical protein
MSAELVLENFLETKASEASVEVQSSKLAELLDKGLLTDQESSSEKRKIIHG